MIIVLNGYYGYANAGDEAVLAAILEALGQRLGAGVQFIVTSGNPTYTISLHRRPGLNLSAIPRQHPAMLFQAIRCCDLFVSGGGSLIQDATSVRNVVYYTSLMRFARMCGKPVIAYAQGVGPLKHPRSQKLTQLAMQRASAVTVRDPESKALLQSLGVTHEIEVTADPVWGLEPAAIESGAGQGDAPVWCVSLRNWLNVENEADVKQATFRAVFEAARAAGARLRLLPMQASTDGPLNRAAFQAWGDAAQDEMIATEGRHPRELMAEAGSCRLMIAMRLHALIFAAAQGIPCVALSYDPKVDALAKLVNAPVLRPDDFRVADAAERVMAAVKAARAPKGAALADLRAKAMRNADVAAGLVG